MIVIAHLSDIHIHADEKAGSTSGARNSARTRSIVDHLARLPYDLDAVVVTGDIADHGRASEYEQAGEILASRHPTVLCPGNHDARAAFRRALLRQPEPPEAEGCDEAPVNQVLRLPRCVIAACDSSIPGENEGYLDDGTLAWLDGVLRETPGHLPVLVAFHHPPAPLQVPFVDAMRQRGAERLAALADRHANIAGFLCGHAHTPAAASFAGRPLRVAPGVASTLRLPWEDQSPALGQVHLDHPPALAFHVLDDEGRLTTHYRYVAG